ncbi:MAG: zinc ribbon domain-containing protein [Clostridiales bacterium]|nr:zinc ribbon domain-containing protein [Clostridiales bacterium]
MNNAFRDAEISFQALRRQFRSKEISRREFIDRLKKLRLRDSQGRFWMIGAQTGKWYYFDGHAWVRADPPVQEIKKVKCYTCGLENDAEAEFCERCRESLREKEASCPRCGAKLENPFQKCPACSQQPETAEAASMPFAEQAFFKKKGEENAVLRRLNPSSCLFLSGGTGLLAGVIIGAFLGASEFFSGLGRGLPDFFGTLQGTLMGGIVFAILGGILGFALLGLVGYLEAHVFNAISSIIGGIRITLDKKTEADKEKESEEK